MVYYAKAGTDTLLLTYTNPSDSGVYNYTATDQLGSAWRIQEEGITIGLYTLVL